MGGETRNRELRTQVQERGPLALETPGTFWYCRSAEDQRCKGQSEETEQEGGSIFSPSGLGTMGKEEGEDWRRSSVVRSVGVHEPKAPGGAVPCRGAWPCSATFTLQAATTPADPLSTPAPTTDYRQRDSPEFVAVPSQARKI